MLEQQLTPQWMSLLFIAYLQILNTELVPVHINGREEDGLHLVVSQLVGGKMGSYQHLSEED